MLSEKKLKALYELAIKNEKVFNRLLENPKSVKKYLPKFTGKDIDELRKIMNQEVKVKDMLKSRLALQILIDRYAGFGGWMHEIPFDLKKNKK